MQQVQIQSLAGELKSHMLCSVAKKKKKRMPLPLDVVSEHYFIFLEHSFKKEKLKTPQKK